jgi:hypothetical protein
VGGVETARQRVHLVWVDVEIQLCHVGPDLQFATANVAKSTAEGSALAPAAG